MCDVFLTSCDAALDHVAREQHKFEHARQLRAHERIVQRWRMPPPQQHETVVRRRQHQIPQIDHMDHQTPIRVREQFEAGWLKVQGEWVVCASCYSNVASYIVQVLALSDLSASRVCACACAGGGGGGAGPK